MLFPPPVAPVPPPRVVVTGLGIITALGQGYSPNASGFRSGRTAFRPVTLFDVSRQRAKVAAEVDLPETVPGTRLSTRQLRRLDRATWMLFLAADEALAQAAWDLRRLTPIVLGTTAAGMHMGEAFFKQAVTPPFSRRLQPSRVVFYQAQRQTLALQEAFAIEGPTTLVANACASSANAIGLAFEMLRSGRAERAIAGGYESLCQLVFAGFDSLQALSPTRCRPFDLRRDGLALGEGAALLALETLESAQARRASILGEILGYGWSLDRSHITQPHPQGDAILEAMKMACAQAGVGPERIGYVNAHGTGTPLNDSAEATALIRWAGSHAPGLRVSSTKGGIGHLLGAAGAVEAVVCLMALREGWLPPTTTIETPDPACGFELVRAPADDRLEYALTNSIGFGGANATLILRRYPG